MTEENKESNKKRRKRIRKEIFIQWEESIADRKRKYEEEIRPYTEHRNERLRRLEKGDF
jgi:hypothetical protein